MLRIRSSSLPERAADLEPPLPGVWSGTVPNWYWGARRLDRLQALAKELSLSSSDVVQTDVTQHDQVKHLVDQAVQAHGRVDVIINNAGLMPHSPLERCKIEDWDQMIDVNLKGVLYGIAAVLPHMIAPNASRRCPLFKILEPRPHGVGLIVRMDIQNAGP